MDNEKLQGELNLIRYYRCEEVRVGDMCHYFFPERAGFRQVVKSFLKLLYYSLFNTCTYAVKGNPTTLSLFSNSYSSRADHRKAFDHVTELIENQILFVPSKRRIRLVSPRTFFLPLIWMFQSRKVPAPFARKISLITNLYKAYVDYTYVQKQIQKKKLSIHYFLSFCDVMPIDFFFVQKFHAQGLVTVTLQHGSFNIKNNAWAYSASKSDYFLAESPAAADAAYSVGYQGNMIPVGSPHQLKMEEKNAPESVPEIESVGVIMNSDAPKREDHLRMDNIEMLKTVQEYCRNMNKRMLVKFHPSNHPEDYSSYIDLTISKMYGRDITIDEFGDLSDVVIVSASTVFTTMLKRWKPVFLFVRENADPDAFPRTDWLKFQSSTQLSDFVETVQSPEYWEKLGKCRAYNLCDGCYRDNYIKALRQIGMDTVS